MKQTIINGQIRAVLPFIGGILASLGVMESSTFEIIAGAALAIVSHVWSAYEKLRKG